MDNDRKDVAKGKEDYEIEAVQGIKDMLRGAPGEWSEGGYAHDNVFFNRGLPGILLYTQSGIYMLTVEKISGAIVQLNKKPDAIPQ